MSIKFVSRLVLFGGIASSSLVMAAGPSPEMLSHTCAACHGTNGSSVAFTPSIAGNSEEYFIDSMKAFKSGERKATVMDRIAKGYSDDEIAKMASYFAKQPMKPMKQAYSASMAEMGKKLHEESCNKCHEDGGKKADDGGILAGQSLIYMQHSMEDFKAGSREAPKKMRKRVKNVVDKHGQKGIDALLNYYASQQ